MDFVTMGKDKVYYETTKGDFTTGDNERYIAYGIRAYKMNGNAKVKLDEFDDISVDYEFVNNLADTFNKEDLHIEHFRDVIFDAVDR